MTGAEYDSLVGSLLALLRATSISTQEERVAATYRAMLDEAGFDTEVDEWGNVIGRHVFGPGPVVLHDAHLDTVEVTDPDRWQHDPAGELSGGLVFGRGAVDTKASLAAALHAGRRLVERGAGGGTLVLVGSVGEELTEGAALLPVLQRIRPDVVVIGEPSDNALVLGQRGRAEIMTEVHGRASHSAFPDSGVNAAEVMADCLVALRDLDPAADPVLGPGLLTLTNLASSPYPSQSTVPSRCVAVHDRRTVPGETAEQVRAEVAALVVPVAESAGARAEVRLARSDWTTWTGRAVDQEVFAPAWLLPPDSVWVSRATAALREAGIDVPARMWPFCTNGSVSAGRLGIPTIGLGPGDPSRAHTVDEAIPVDDLQAGAAACTAVFDALLAVPPGAEPHHRTPHDPGANTERSAT